MSTTTPKDALTKAHALGVERLDAQWLLLHALDRPSQDRSWLLTHDEEPLTAAQVGAYDALLQRRVEGEPLAYLVGHQEFFGLNLQVDARVLVPRPDTETLVHWALDVLGGLATPDGGNGQLVDLVELVNLVDLGTGSGAVALALAHRLRQRGQRARVLAVDASLDALQVARANALALELRVDFLPSNWLAQVKGRHHLIVSNPPYVAAQDPHLAALHHEPLRALAAGPDGLDDLRTIIAQAPAHLVNGGWLLLEHGYDQATAVRDLLHQAGFVQLGSRPDLAGIMRCSGGRWLGPQRGANSEIIKTS